MHLALASENVNNATPENITFVPDDTLGLAAAADDALLPVDMPYAAMAYFGGSGMTYARLHTQWLTTGRGVRPYFMPIDTAANPGDLPPVHDLRDNPWLLHDPRLGIQGKLNAQIANGGAAQSRALILLSDGPVQPVKDLRGVIPIRWTATYTTTAAERWESFSPTLAEDLPVGEYELVDNRTQAATGLAWRVIPPKGVGGNDSSLRPGWLTQTTDVQKRGLPIGALGPLCRFRTDNLPQFQIAASSAAVQAPKGIMYVRPLKVS